MSSLQLTRGQELMARQESRQRYFPRSQCTKPAFFDLLCFCPEAVAAFAAIVLTYEICRIGSNPGREAISGTWQGWPRSSTATKFSQFHGLERSPISESPTHKLNGRHKAILATLSRRIIFLPRYSPHFQPLLDELLSLCPLRSRHWSRRQVLCRPVLSPYARVTLRRHWIVKFRSRRCYSTLVFEVVCG
jgi:hypothetical protein